jgi:predicted transposase/invertase (TIGR01784 family)
MILDINHPHDAFCREFFSRTDLAAELLARHLPVSSALDLSRLELVKDAFVDTDLQEHFSDLLFRAPFKRGGDAYACLVFEHKSKPYKWIGFQTLDYKTRLWGQALREGAKKLPPIIPFVLYHGQRRWKHSRRFSDSLNWGGHEQTLRRYVADFEYFLFDLSAYDTGNPDESAGLRGGLGLLKHIFDKQELKARLPELLRWLAQVPAAPGQDAVWTALRYLSAGSTLQTNELKEALDMAFPLEKGVLMPSMARKWYDEGREEAMLSVTMRQLRRRIGILGAELEGKVQALPLAQMEDLSEALLDFSAHDDLTNWLNQNAPQGK